MIGWLRKWIDWELRWENVSLQVENRILKEECERLETMVIKKTEVIRLEDGDTILVFCEFVLRADHLRDFASKWEELVLKTTGKSVHAMVVEQGIRTEIWRPGK